VDNTINTQRKSPSWRQRNQSNLQVVAIGLGIIALFSLIFFMQDEETAFAGICLALLGVVFNIFVWNE
jgi:hypothetical protein